MEDNQAQQSSLPSQHEVLLQEGNALQCLIVMQAKALQDVVQKLLNLLLLPNMKTAAMSVQKLLRDYIDKACALATKLGVLEAPGGNSDGPLPIRGQVRKSRLAPTPIPMSKVFARLNPSIQAPPQVQETEDNSITTVEQALRRIELAASVDTPYQGPLPTSPIGNMGTPPAGLGDVASQHSDADDETTQDASDNQTAGGVAASS